MKIVSYNVRGLGSVPKRRVLRELVSKEQIDLLCVQETKLEELDVQLCSQVWGDTDFDWQATPAVNRGGGLLCIWKRGTFKLQQCVSGHGFLGLVGV